MAKQSLLGLIGFCNNWQFKCPPQGVAGGHLTLAAALAQLLQTLEPKHDSG